MNKVILGLALPPAFAKILEDKAFVAAVLTPAVAS